MSRSFRTLGFLFSHYLSCCWLRTACWVHLQGIHIYNRQVNFSTRVIKCFVFSCEGCIHDQKSKCVWTLSTFSLREWWFEGIWVTWRWVKCVEFFVIRISFSGCQSSILPTFQNWSLVIKMWRACSYTIHGRFSVKLPLRAWWQWLNRRLCVHLGFCYGKQIALHSEDILVVIIGHVS